MVLWTRLAAIDAANKMNVDGSSRDMDSSMSVLGKRNRTMGDAMDTGAAVGGNFEKRPRGGTLEISRAVDLGVVKEHAQWWNPELKPQVEAHNSSAAEGVDGAASEWVADQCNRVLGQELSSEGEA